MNQTMTPFATNTTGFISRGQSNNEQQDDHGNHTENAFRMNAMQDAPWTDRDRKAKARQQICQG